MEVVAVHTLQLLQLSNLMLTSRMDPHCGSQETNKWWSRHTSECTKAFIDRNTEECTKDPFKQYDWKNIDEESTRRWRNATFTLNGARRFRYTKDISSRNRKPLNRFRISVHTVCACWRFRYIKVTPTDAIIVDSSILVQLLQDRRLEDFQKLGGVEGLANSLQTDLEKGLDENEEQMQKRRDSYGANTYPKKTTKGFWSFVWDACKDTALIILMVCAVVSLATGMWTDGVQKGWYEGTSIGVDVVLVIAVTSISDYKQDLNFRNLNKEKENIQLLVLRAGQRQMVSIFNLVVGDIVPLSIGGQVPADGILVEGHSLSIDESTMTGESLPVKKDRSRPFLLSGCKVQDGQGAMLVTGVGLNREWGQVIVSISEDNGDETPLRVRLNCDATTIGKAGLLVAVVVFIILIIRYFAITFKNASASDKTAMKVIKELVHIFSIAVIIVVVAVPEGLPLAVTLTLAYSMRKLMAYISGIW